MVSIRRIAQQNAIITNTSNNSLTLHINVVINRTIGDYRNPAFSVIVYIIIAIVRHNGQLGPQN